MTIRIDGNGKVTGRIHVIYKTRENGDKLNGEFVNPQVRFDHWIRLDGLDVMVIEGKLGKTCIVTHQTPIRALGTPGMVAYANRIKGKEVHFDNLGKKIESDETVLAKIAVVMTRMTKEQKLAHIKMLQDSMNEEK